MLGKWPLVYGKGMGIGPKNCGLNGIGANFIPGIGMGPWKLGGTTGICGPVPSPFGVMTNGKPCIANSDIMCCYPGSTENTFAALF